MVDDLGVMDGVIFRDMVFCFLLFLVPTDVCMRDWKRDCIPHCRTNESWCSNVRSASIEEC